MDENFSEALERSARYITRITGLATLLELAPAVLSKAVPPMLLGTTGHEGSRAR